MSVSVFLPSLSGQWQQALSKHGADVVAFDNEATLRPTDHSAHAGTVRRGDDRKAGWYPHRALLLVFPPDTDMAERTLQAYRGDWLLYVGEGRGGANATPAFMDTVERDWDCVHVEPLPTFPRCHERLLVFRRRAPSQRPWWTGVASYLW